MTEKSTALCYLCTDDTNEAVESYTAAAGFANSAAHLSFGQKGSKAASNYRQKILLWHR
jgi:hypothetical protein